MEERGTMNNLEKKFKEYLQDKFKEPYQFGLVLDIAPDLAEIADTYWFEKLKRMKKQLLPQKIREAYPDKQQIDNQKYLNYKEVEEVLLSFRDRLIIENKVPLCGGDIDRFITSICSLAIKPLTRDRVTKRLDKIFTINGDDLCNFQLEYKEELSQEDWTAKEAKEQMLNDIATEIIEGKEGEDV